MNDVISHMYVRRQLAAWSAADVLLALVKLFGIFKESTTEHGMERTSSSMHFYFPTLNLLLWKWATGILILNELFNKTTVNMFNVMSNMFLSLLCVWTEKPMVVLN